MPVGTRSAKSYIALIAAAILLSATRLHAQEYHQECWNQYYGCSRPCDVNIGIKGTNWWDGCMADCKAKQRACDAALDQTSAPPSPAPTPEPSPVDLQLQQQQEAESRRRDQVVGKVNDFADRWNASVEAGTMDEAAAERILEEFRAWRRGLTGDLDFMIAQGGREISFSGWLDEHEGFYVSSLADIRRQAQSPEPQTVVPPAAKDTSVPRLQPRTQPQRPKPAPVRRDFSDQEIEVITRAWFGAIGYDADDFAQAADRTREWLKAAGERAAAAQRASALTKRKAADEEFLRTARDGSIRDAATREALRQSYLDAWLDNPKDKKTSMMMAVLEKENGNPGTARAFENAAYMNLIESERNFWSAAVIRAKETMSDRLEREGVNRALLNAELERSSFMNQIRQNVGTAMSDAQQSAQDVCREIVACDWAWMKKVAVSTEAEKLSAEVKSIMNDPLKELFGIDKESVEKAIHEK